MDQSALIDHLDRVEPTGEPLSEFFLHFGIGIVYG
jgi:hypothetical protein